MVSAEAVGMEGFMVIRLGRQVLCREFRASGCFFRFLTLKKQKHKNRTGNRNNFFL